MLELGQTFEPRQLIPGDPVVVQALAEALRQLGGRAEATAFQLAKIDLSNWTGAAADAYQNYHAQEPGQWENATDAFGKAADLLIDYADTLSMAQAEAAIAAAEWQQGNQQQATQILTQARDRIDEYSVDIGQLVADAARAAPTGPALGQPASANTNASGATVPSVYIDADRHPETAEHVHDAQNGTIWRGDTSSSGTPLPSVLTIDRPNAKTNRADSLRGIPTRAGKDRDEYPPAMFEEGGAGASVKYIDPADNRGAGSSMGHQIKALNLGDGQRVRIEVLNSDDEAGNTDDTENGEDEAGNDADGDTGDDPGDTGDTGEDEANLTAITNPLWG
ncbi:MAG TPA: NucA/NucB deoxyribonuclease domain-containing protein [Pseudonocardiaceae bacterium]|nr:NucA/NucB deoxyribonuclease domain-containing protein [Pseudonocardiaceae bacterium]